MTPDVPPRAPRVVVVGDLIYDLFARTGGRVALGVDTFAPIGVAAGGSGANAAAWLAREGIETHFVGRIGDDVFGDFLEGEMERVGTKPHLTRDPSLATGKVFVLVDGAGERTMITDRGVGEALNPRDLPEQIFGGGHLHLSGYTLSGGTRRQTAFRALRLARDAGMTVSVDPSSAPLLASVGPERFLEWTRGADLLFPNLGEGALLAEKTDPHRIAEELLRYYRAIVLKLGADGALYRDADGVTAHVRATPTEVVDTTGAGDALCAGFLSARLSGETPREALARGADLAARAVGALGGSPEA